LASLRENFCFLSHKGAEFKSNIFLLNFTKKFNKTLEETMRKTVIAGNWKMNNDLKESEKLIVELKNLLQNEKPNCDVIVCPPFTSLLEASKLVNGSFIKLGAQNMHFEDSGAFTGEISASMLKSVGCEYVILGHSERRTIFGEDDELINKKIKKALAEGLKPIFCVGELLEERETGITNDVIKKQVLLGLAGITEAEMKNIIIAYEPVWAIGTGKTASPRQAQEVHEFIRDLIEIDYSLEIANDLVIQYGGSVKPDNAKELLSQKDIDGALVGGACLKADSFMGIIKGA
jgi:triosephosphate isomerase